MPCKHEWREERNFNPPIFGINDLSAPNAYVGQKILFGFTNIYRVCTKCGKDKVTTLIGDNR